MWVFILLNLTFIRELRPPSLIYHKPGLQQVTWAKIQLANGGPHAHIITVCGLLSSWPGKVFYKHKVGKYVKHSVHNFKHAFLKTKLQLKTNWLDPTMGSVPQLWGMRAMIFDLIILWLSLSRQIGECCGQ